jgi:hypothetical protein
MICSSDCVLDLHIRCKGNRLLQWIADYICGKICGSLHWMQQSMRFGCANLMSHSSMLFTPRRKKEHQICMPKMHGLLFFLSNK